VIELHDEFDRMQLIYGEKSLRSIYGAGQVINPKFCFVFMNPTGRNVSASPAWKGMRAPWIGTKQVWKLFVTTKLLSENIYEQITSLKPTDWTPDFAKTVYEDLAEHSVYLTNLAKCTQLDARPLPNQVFKEYRESLLREIESVKPLYVVTLGNQVSSIVLQRVISVGINTSVDDPQTVVTRNSTFNVYPVHYPVGQGLRNMPLSVRKISMLLSK